MENSKKWFYLILVVIFFYLFYQLLPVIFPFGVAFILAYLLNPVLVRICTKGLSRQSAVLLLLLLFVIFGLILALIIGPVLLRQFIGFIKQVPSLINWLNQELPSYIERKLNVVDAVIPTEYLKSSLIAKWQDLEAGIENIIVLVSKSGIDLIHWVFNLALVPLITYYLLNDWEKVIKACKSLVPWQYVATLDQILDRVDVILSSFIRGQLIVMASLGIFYGVLLSLAGIKMGLLIGFIAGTFSIIPYLGFVVGLLIALLASIYQFGTILAATLVMIIFSLGHIIEAFVLTPKLVGDKMGLHPIAVIFAVLAFSKIFGATGAMLALPGAALVVAILQIMRIHMNNKKLVKKT